MFQWSGCKPRRAWLVRWFSNAAATVDASTAANPKKYKKYVGAATASGISVSVGVIRDEPSDEKEELIEDIEAANEIGSRYNLRPRRKGVVYTA